MTDLAYWNNGYQTVGKVWGDQPSELARAAAAYLKNAERGSADERLLDIGCGYGRDALFLATSFPMTVVGIEPSIWGVEMARKSAADQALTNITFAPATFQDWCGEAAQFIYAANLYQILPVVERAAFRKAIPRLLLPGGVLFLGNHSVRDPELADKGRPVCGDPNSFVDKHFMHLATREELETDFSFLQSIDLQEIEFYEPRANGPAHHHVTWILIAQRER